MLIIPGIILGIIRFYFGIKLPIFDLTVFTFYSSFFETKYFTFVQNNFGEEVPGLLILIGLFLFAVAKEKIEESEFNDLRLQAFLLSLYTNTLLMAISFLFVFGLGFIDIMVANIYSLITLYILVFHYMLLKYKRKNFT